MSERKVFLLVLLIVAVPVLGTIAIVAISTRPSLTYRTFSGKCQDPAAMVVDWSMLYRLSEKQIEQATAQEILSSTVCLPGYMISSDDRPDGKGRVGQFFLVPDPGNWLHPAHLDDAVVVKIQGGARVALLMRKAVSVEGRLNREQNQAWHLDAWSVRELRGLR